MSKAGGVQENNPSQKVELGQDEEDSDSSADEKYSREGSYHSEDDLAQDEPDATASPVREVYILGDTMLPVPKPLSPRVTEQSTSRYPSFYSGKNCLSPQCRHLIKTHLKTAYVVMFLFLLWGTMWGMTEKEALPGGNLFALFVLLLLCFLCGRLIALIYLPPLLGMLIMGCLLKNVSFISFAEKIDPQWASCLRMTALVVILTRGGLGLDPKVLRKLSRTCLQLALLPCLVEALILALAAYLLMDFPPGWSLLTGFIVAAVSPAVVVSLMIRLQEQGYGVDKGIPVLVIASSSIDDILAITAFGIVFASVFSTGQSIVWIALKGPAEAFLGILYGLILGTSFWFIPHDKGTTLHSVMLFGAGMFVTFVSPLLELSSMGPLGTLTTAFVAGLRWRSQGCLEGPSRFFARIWIVFEPFLFGLIGTEVDFSLVNPSHIGMSCIILIVALAFRMAVSMVAVSCAGFTMSEILFVAFAWMPKATVQAALAPLALDEVRRQHLPEPIQKLALQVLTIAVVSIVITAPLGAIAINLAGPRLLAKSPTAAHSTHL